MKRFTRKNKPLMASRPTKRMFNSSKRDKDALLKKVAHLKQPPTTQEVHREQILEKLHAPRPGLETPAHLTKASLKEAPIEEIDRFIDNNSKRLQLELENKKPAFELDSIGPIETPTRFDGLTDSSERLRLLEEELTQSRRQAAALGHQMRLLKEDFEEEKSELEKTVHDLRLELHRTKPLGEHALFSLSKELKTAITEIDGLVRTTPSASMTQIKADDLLPQEDSKPSEQTLQQDTDISRTQESPVPSPLIPSQVKNPNRASEDITPHKEKNKKKKLLLSGAATIVLLLVTSAGISVKLFSRPEVDEQLVNEYLSQNEGTVAGATSETVVDGKAQPTEAKTRSEQELDKSQADVNFEDTVWEQVVDPMFGIAIDSPSNVVGITKTDSNITFMRKGGYILKVQRVETDLDVESYWEQIKGASMNYEVESLKVLNNEALHLKLQDTTDFPGNRYLVKRGDVLFDVWYAVESSVYDSADIQRVKRMLDSIRYINKVID